MNSDGPDPNASFYPADIVQQGGEPQGPDTASSHPKDACPKCETLWRHNTACSRCGLLRKNCASFLQTQATEASAFIQSLWENCQKNWSDDTAHEKLLAVCAHKASDLQAVGRLYRSAGRQGRPIDWQMAKIQAYAQTHFVSTSHHRNPRRLGRWITILVVVGLGILGISLFRALRILAQ